MPSLKRWTSVAFGTWREEGSRDAKRAELSCHNIASDTRHRILPSEAGTRTEQDRIGMGRIYRLLLCGKCRCRKRRRDSNHRAPGSWSWQSSPIKANQGQGSGTRCLMLGNVGAPSVVLI